MVLSDPRTEADSVLLSDSSVSLKELHRKHQDLHNAQEDLLASSAMPAKSCAALVGERKSHLFQFYLGLLDCICVVTKGRNSRAHHFFKTHAERFGVGYAHLLRAIGDEELPSSYKLRCCRLIEQLYVDTDPHTEVQAESLTHIWPRALRAADIKDDTLLHAFEYLDSNPLADLKAVLLQLVERYQRMNVEEMEKNRSNSPIRVSRPACCASLGTDIMMGGLQLHPQPGPSDLGAAAVWVLPQQGPRFQRRICRQRHHQHHCDAACSHPRWQR